MTPPKVIIVGLDSVPPALAFQYYKDVMPNFSALCDEGSFGPLRSTDPPITIPAWVSMTTGKNPGQLGMYGFQRHIGPGKARLICTDDIQFPRIWDLAAASKQRSVVVSVPLTYPAKPSPLITMTTGFLTPSTETRWATRPSLARQLHEQFGEYIIDVSDFRSTDIKRIYRDCVQFTQQHFAIFRHLIRSTAPQFAMMVDLGPDRLHHAALRYILPTHPKFEPSDIGRRYYQLLDNEIGRTLELAGGDTLVMVVSDHGVRPLEGCVCINELLINQGYLVLDEPYPTTPTPIEKLRIDWSRTVATAKGGYVGRVFIHTNTNSSLHAQNTQRRNLLHSIRRCIETLPSPTESPLHHKIFHVDELYPEATGTPPDLTIYFDNLRLRAAGTIGHRALFIPTNDNGPDDANHDYHGILAANQPLDNSTEYLIYDVFQTALHALGLPMPTQTNGRALQLTEENGKHCSVQTRPR
ncbi:MAG: alkaline phosphatase family protein [Deltaproteobacteria bacterium]|nr:alkaline phosphatase family protein [Deltaproteobacteria bacterium]MBN2673905.1 alkaline phosphatase family protein [Deltaproteobacteria bacterium]